MAEEVTLLTGGQGAQATLPLTSAGSPHVLEHRVFELWEIINNWVRLIIYFQRKVIQSRPVPYVADTCAFLKLFLFWLNVHRYHS